MSAARWNVFFAIAGFSIFLGEPGAFLSACCALLSLNTGYNHVTLTYCNRLHSAIPRLHVPSIVQIVAGIHLLLACSTSCFLVPNRSRIKQQLAVSVIDVISGAGLAVPHQDLGMQIAHGPLSIVIGLAAGILLGFVCALTPVWSSPLSRAAALLVMGELVAFCGWVNKSHLINGSLPGFLNQCLIHVAFECAVFKQPSHFMAWHAMIHNAMLCHAVLCYVVSCCVVLCYALLYQAVHHCAMLWCVT